MPEVQALSSHAFHSCLPMTGCHILRAGKSTSYSVPHVCAGCVPVFVGPPWHALPFPDQMDYRHAAIFINISDSSKWMQTDHAPGSAWQTSQLPPDLAEVALQVQFIL